MFALMMTFASYPPTGWPTSGVFIGSTTRASPQKAIAKASRTNSSTVEGAAAAAVELVVERKVKQNKQLGAIICHII